MLGMRDRSVASRKAPLMLGIVANCITAGTIQLFSLVSVPLARTLNLSASQTALIATASLGGQYLSAAVWGDLCDRKGPALVSWISAGLFAISYSVLGWRYQLLERRLGAGGGAIGPHEWLLFAAVYHLSGWAATASYFSAVIASTKSLPARHSGIAIGVPSSIFGLSPFFLSLFATFFTSDVTDELDPGRWFYFLAIILVMVNCFGGLTLSAVPFEDELSQEEVTVAVEEEEATESTFLLRTATAAHEREESQPLSRLFSDPTFWSLFAIILLATGPAEMLMGTLGSLVEALLGIQTQGDPDRRGLGLRSLHVRIISVSQTLSRLLAGAISDWLTYSAAPLPPSLSSHPPSPIISYQSEPPTRFTQFTLYLASFFRKPPRVSRLAFVLGSCLLLAAAFFYTAFILDSASQLSILTVSVGLGYGSIYTLAPSIVRAVFPVQDFGRNFGLLAWSGLTGTIIFTPLFGILMDRAAEKQESEICYGPECWHDAFVLSTLSALLAGGVVILLWRRLRGKV